MSRESGTSQITGRISRVNCSRAGSGPSQRERLLDERLAGLHYGDKQAIAWVRRHGAEHGADPSVLVVAGSSAGAHLASMAALTPNDPAFQPGFEGALSYLRSRLSTSALSRQRPRAERTN
jgi:alpha/beta hydrolase fold